MTDFKQRIAAIFPQDESMRRLIHSHDGNLAIMTSDGANCLGFFDPAHRDACGQMAQVIDAYNDALPLLQEMQAEIERLTAENEDFEERIEAAVDILNKDDPNQFSTIIASKFILEHGLKDVREALQ